MIAMNKKILISVVILAAAAAATFFALEKRHEIAVTRPDAGPAVEAVYATGTVEPTVMLPIAPRSAGRLEELLADEGQEVEKDQLLARLEDQDLRNTVAELQARAELARKEFDRRAALTGSGAFSKEALDRARADMEAANAALERARVTLDYMKLTAPDDGRIIRREGEVGELIPANQPVFWLSCCSGLRVSAEVDEEDIALVQPGQKTVIRADAFPDDIFEGTVQSITPKGDPVARSYRVRIGLAPDVKLMIGMTAETNIVIREAENALLLPPSAVDGKSVWVAQGGVLHRREVEIGARTAEAVEIKSGLSESDIVVRDLSALKEAPQDGMKADTRLKQWDAP